MNVLFILGHPRTRSLCGALTDAYGKGASEAGAEVRRLGLATLDFDPHVHTLSPNQQAFENDILNARELILRAEHLVFVYPPWWGTMPALYRAAAETLLSGPRRTRRGGHPQHRRDPVWLCVPGPSRISKRTQPPANEPSRYAWDSQAR
ncbi:MAG: NAD(P)H-dependent oxidoreductase [Thiobacillus sp.]